MRTKSDSALIMKLYAVVLTMLITATVVHADERFTYGDGEATLTYFIHMAKQAAPIETVTEQIYVKDEILYCTGESEAAIANNHAAELMRNADFEGAIAEYTKALKHAPLFLPFRYNIGVCYIHVNDRARALLNLNKARDIVPEYFLTDVQLGHLAVLDGNDDGAILHYRSAIKKNPKYIDAMVLVGNIYFRRHQREMASKYYEAVLTISPRFANALLGRAKIMFDRGEIYKAYQTFGMINIDGEYDKSLHYYYAECSYKLQDYKRAYEHYTMLLAFKNDRFFITTSVKLIEHKQELARRFATQLEEQ
jgi:tetratricopeptide (TPR) repeat protein